LRRDILAGFESERLQMGQDLHDGPLQHLYAAQLLLRELVEDVPDAGALAVIDRVRDGLDAVIARLQEACGELHPPVLETFGLARAIREAGVAFIDANPAVALALDLPAEEPELPMSMRLALFRIFSNALANAERHAAAERIAVRLSYDGSVIRLDVDDDGRGVDMPDNVRDLMADGHFGIAQSLARARLLGGDMTLESRLGEGMRVRVVVPL
jgi:signal transduction histidine kinase